jgi:HEAT repeat protein
MGDSGAIPALEPLLDNPDPGFRARVAQALKLLSWQPQDPRLEALYLVALGELDRAAILGRAAVGALAQMLNDPAYQRRVVAVNRLAEIGDPSAVRPLMGALHDIDAVVRTAAANALGRLEGVEAVKSLLALLRDKEPNVRSAVAEALGHIGDLQAVKALIPVVKDPHWEVRSAAVEALGRLRDHRATEAVCSCLRDSDREVREQAADSLGVLGDTRGAAPLVVAMLDVEKVVRHAASRALQRVDPYWERLPAVREVLPTIRDALHHSDYGIQQAATEILRRCGEKHAQPAHTSITSARRKRHGTEEILSSLLKDPDPALRQAAVECLSRHEGWTPGDWLERLAEDPDLSVRSSADLAARRVAARQSIE